MIQLNLEAEKSRPLQILCLGCHSDDIEIGCGGSILRLAKKYPDCEFHWVVFSALGTRESEAKHAAELFVPTAQLKGPLLKSFPDGFMPYVGAEVKSVFEELKQKISPGLVFTHNRKDAHQDHRLIAELTWNTFRDHLILEYEIPKYDGDMGQPSVFVPLEMETCHKKVSFLMEAFQSQRQKRWFQPETFLSLMRLRGMECNSSSGYAEAFYCRKLVM
ncbi:LmbE family N-acetylglucosaminyl deacetylase [Silvibacterium bohemicum]|uniref:LmbE family N-acetylglucosaminyl deacetylase n=1 Tax=Silvibacterium bohemicum TaxID=1577686 RepID=A0A841JWN8_9BACT|nr:PIG-L deacetylase family protein [Silvibacterium bohemicum]MBB6142858.1 LmbE family N-acetylglucosaminyl deacetylase [Silvibacterium bohemicum]